MSLLYTAQGLARAGHRPVIALIRPSEDLSRLYGEAGLEVHDWPGITTFEHTTAFWTSLARPDHWSLLVRMVTGWEKSQRRTRELVERIQPDIVHLNSVVLAPAAAALRGVLPVVWHVREHPVHGHLGVRRGWLRRALLAWPSEVIFLSEAEKQAWVGGQRGVVVPNFVQPGELRLRDNAVASPSEAHPARRQRGPSVCGRPGQDEGRLRDDRGGVDPRQATPQAAVPDAGHDVQALGADGIARGAQRVAPGGFGDERAVARPGVAAGGRDGPLPELSLHAGYAHVPGGLGCPRFSCGGAALRASHRRGRGHGTADGRLSVYNHRGAGRGW